MKKQLTALVLCICMVLSVLPFSSTQAAAEEMSSVGTSNISIGDYIRLGNYNGQPILWRCVDVDEMGPLMLSIRCWQRWLMMPKQVKTALRVRTAVT